MGTDGQHRGRPGASARAEAERIAARRREATAGRSTTVRVLRALLGPTAAERQLTASERHFRTGARGEELLAATLARRCPGVPILHDRRIPGGRANIDHLAFTASGIWVIDAKRHLGSIRVRRPLFGRPRLEIAGRDRTSLLRGLERQVQAVRTALGEGAGETPVHGCLCFLAPAGRLAEPGLPAVGTLHLAGFPLLDPRRLARRLNRPGAIDPARAQELCELLARRLPQAPA